MPTHTSSLHTALSGERLHTDTLNIFELGDLPGASCPEATTHVLFIHRVKLGVTALPGYRA